MYRLKQLLFLLLVLVAAMLVGSATSRCYGYTFNGTVLYDNTASRGRYPGYRETFSGGVELDSGEMCFRNPSTQREFADFGTVFENSFSQGGVNYYYALSEAPDGRSKMGLIWWSEPVSLKVPLSNGDDYFQQVYGLAFSFEGALLYTPAQMIAMRLDTYLQTGFLPELYNTGQHSLYVTGCQLSAGRAFFGLLESPLPAAAEKGSPVPLPPAGWLLGSGMLALFGWRKKREWW